LHEGWIEGKERTVTCISGEYTWRGRTEPTVHLFDLNGREKDHRFPLAKSAKGWRVRVHLRDWVEIAVIE